jgi:short-subunit dehydrogenase
MRTSALSALYRTAFVTGASTGLGRAFAGMLLDQGVEVWGTARAVARLPAHERFHPVALELADGPAAEKIFHESDRAAGGFDLVIQNAGYGLFGEFATVDFADWQRQLEAMLINTARLNQAAWRQFQARGRGTIVNISSLATEYPLPFQAAYNMAKAGLSALSESLIYETRGTGIVVIDFRPGDYRTDFEASVRRPGGPGSPAPRRAWAAFCELMRSGPPPEHAAAALRRALLRRRSGVVRSGRFFQTVLAPFLSCFGTQSLRRRIQARYFGL